VRAVYQAEAAWSPADRSSCPRQPLSLRQLHDLRDFLAFDHDCLIRAHLSCAQIEYTPAEQWSALTPALRMNGFRYSRSIASAAPQGPQAESFDESMTCSVTLARSASRTTRLRPCRCAWRCFWNIEKRSCAGAGRQSGPLFVRACIRCAHRTNARESGNRIEGEENRADRCSWRSESGCGDTTIDLPDSTCFRLIDAHTHLSLILSSLGYQVLAISTAAKRCTARETPASLLTRVLHGCETGAKDYADIALRDAINEG